MIRRHPVADAWDAWKRDNPTLFRGTAEGQYLENRINAAFTAGWLECEQRVTDALGVSIRAARPGVDEQRGRFSS